jgi:hypothetical protein
MTRAMWTGRWRTATMRCNNAMKRCPAVSESDRGEEEAAAAGSVEVEVHPHIRPWVCRGVRVDDSVSTSLQQAPPSAPYLWGARVHHHIYGLLVHHRIRGGLLQQSRLGAPPPLLSHGPPNPASAAPSQLASSSTTTTGRHRTRRKAALPREEALYLL